MKTHKEKSFDIRILLQNRDVVTRYFYKYDSIRPISVIIDWLELRPVLAEIVQLI